MCYLNGEGPFQILEMVERGVIVEASRSGPITAENAVERGLSLYLDRLRAHCANINAAKSGRGPVVIDLDSRRRR
jgi:hypothetical protein